MNVLSIQKGMKNNVTIYLEDEVGLFEEQKGLFEKVEAVINACLDEEKVPYEVEVSLTVVDETSIHEINKEHRDVDRPTDVLSFPQIEPESMGYINWDTVDFSGCMNLDTDEILLGDIILCDTKAKEQAENYGHSLEREVCFLIVHSMLHLLGYDHMTAEDEEVMMSKQEAVLNKLCITRSKTF